MTYEFIGKVIAVYEIPYTNKQTGEQKKQWEVVIEHELSNNPQYPNRRVVVVIYDETVWNTMVYCHNNGQPFAQVKATCSIDAREYNGRWFNGIKCFRAEQFQPQQQQMGGYPQQPMQQGYQQPPMQQQQGFQAPVAPAQPQQMPYQQPAQAYPSAGGQVQGQGNPHNYEPPF